MLNPFPTFSNDSAPMPTLMVVPSGIGCLLGGFAGDAIPSARLLAAASGCLITHPNVMNGASLYWTDKRILYVEGYALDRFASGEIGLIPVRQQKIGILLDAGIEPELIQRQLHVVDACRATLGLNIGPVVTTEVPLEVKFKQGESGASWGDLGHPSVLLRAADRLKEAGATAIAVITRFPDESQMDSLNSAYRQGEGIDEFAGAEALISHLLVRHLGVPSAHAPAMNQSSLPPKLDPRVAAEEIGFTFLPCVLVGLSTAPDLVPMSNSDKSKLSCMQKLLSADHLGAVVVPEGALGGEAVLACLERGLPLITVHNPGVLNVTSEKLGLNDIDSLKSSTSSVIRAGNYAEVAGLLMLLREGINLDSLNRPITRVAPI